MTDAALAATVVTYPAGGLVSRSTVVRLADAGPGRLAVVLDRTAIHPVDTAWPDQPADRGILRTSDGIEHEILDAVVGAVQGDVLVLGRDVPVRTGTEGWTFVVAHIVAPAPIAVGDSVEVEADAAVRAALSRGHTACHLASLALDAALAPAWRKDAPTDALGAPAFDALAIQESRILPDGARDVYRIGKSLRRRGFDPAVLDDLSALADEVDARLAAWIAAGGDVSVEAEGETLADRRTWVCDIGGAEARIPCGGTHAASLAELGRVTVAFQATPGDSGLELVMSTRAGA